VPEEALELAHDAGDYEEGELAGEVEARLRRPPVDGGHQEALVLQQPQAEVEVRSNSSMHWAEEAAARSPRAFSLSTTLASRLWSSVVSERHLLIN